MKNDSVSALLRACRSDGSHLFRLECRAGDTVPAPIKAALAAATLPDAVTVVQYFAVQHGRVRVSIGGAHACLASAGDILIAPSDGDVAFSAEPPFAIASAAPPLGAGNATVACAQLVYPPPVWAALRDALPSFIHLPAAGGSAWTSELLARAMALPANAGPGDTALADRIGEALVMHGLQRHLEGGVSGDAARARTSRDLRIGRALSSIHAEPGRCWSIAQLASASALSRSAFCQRFLEHVGLTPMAYLTHWRMEIATRLLRSDKATIAAIAIDVGYESEAAFSRAFKRVRGAPPARWRRNQLRAAAPA